MKLKRYPEWDIEVVFKDDPTVTYYYSYDIDDSNNVNQAGKSGVSRNSKHLEDYKNKNKE